MYALASTKTKQLIHMKSLKCPALFGLLKEQKIWKFQMATIHIQSDDTDSLCYPGI